MLSDRFFKLFGYQQLIAFYVVGTPYRWDAKNRALYVSKYSYWFYSFAFFSLSLYIIFLLIQLGRYHYMGKTTDFYYYFLYALTMCGIFDMVAASPFWLKPKETAAFLNELFKFLSEIQIFMPSFDPNLACMNWVFDGIVAALTVLSPFCGVVISCHYLIFPHWPCYLSSLFSTEQLPFPIYFLSGAVYFYGLQWIWAVLLFAGMIGLVYGRYIWLVSIEFFCFADNPRGPPNVAGRRIWSQQKCCPSFRSSENIRTRYRQLEVLHWNFMDNLSYIIIPVQIMLTCLGIFCNVSLVRHWKVLSTTNTVILLIWSVGSVLATLVALTFCGAMYIHSCRMLKTIKAKKWGSKKENLLMAKFVQSCKPISYGYGRMYTIRKLSSLKYIKHLTRGTFRALLTSKGKE